MNSIRKGLLIFGALLVWLFLAGGISLYIDSLWFDSVGYWDVFRLSLFARFMAFLAGAGLTFLVLWTNMLLASREPHSEGFWFRQEFVEVTRAGAARILKWSIAGLSLVIGFAAQSHWMEWLQFRSRVEMGAPDPIFNQDLSFYFFELPLYGLLSGYFVLLCFFAIAVSVFGYLSFGHLGYRDGFRFSRTARRHITFLAVSALLALSVYFYFERYSIYYSPSGVIYGPGYSDVNAALPALTLLAAWSAVIAILVLATFWMTSLKPALIGLLSLAVLYLGHGLYPLAIQTFIVAPNEIQKESPFIERHVDATLRAYQLDKVESHEFSTGERLTEQDLRDEDDTIRNIRLWDWRPLKDVYGQLQAIRLYYTFDDVDVDRYVINGKYRQVMLSARELDFDKISESAQNWINKHFQYTHGHGLCMSPVNEVTAEGLPDFFIKDIPPRSRVDIQVTRPEIYFGEKTDYPVFVKTNLPEFDYPIGNTNATTTYQADRGIPINSLLMRLAFSWELGTYQVIFTGNFTPESRVLLHRQIQERARRIAPFLMYDQDPYLVIDQGKLYWMQDAYTVSRRYPNSEPFPSRNSPLLNYLRNSVKVVTDAYTGDVSFYLWEESDPLVQVYARIFPVLFKSKDQMPEGLREHVRYPTDFFDVQRSIFRQYHMKDPTVFYNQEDAWEIPSEIYGQTDQVMDSYYTIMKLPGGEREELVLLIPYTPRNKDNMIAWMAARSDGDHYGHLLLFQFPKQELTYGPMQVEARIDQDPDISQLITLWSQKGSKVIRGNLLVIPIAQSLLYVEPLYLQAEQSEIPELTRVIVVYENRVTLEKTLNGAVAKAVGDRLPADQPLTAQPEPTEAKPVPGGDPAARALDHYRKSLERLRAGDWAGFGEEQKKLEAVLEELTGRKIP